MPRLSVPLTHRTVHRAGVRLHVVDAGPADGEPVILLHGFPEFWYGWRAQIPALAAAGYRVVVPDQRGYNRSDTPAAVAAYDLRHLVDDVHAVIASTEAERAHVVGHDWGAAVAWALAAWHPTCVRRLAILNVPHLDVFHRTLRTSPAQLLRSAYIFFFQLPRLPERILSWRDHAVLAHLLVRSGQPDTFSKADLAAYRVAWRRPGVVRSMLHWYRAAARRALAGPAPLGCIEPPTLVIWGARDVALQRAMARPSVAQCRQGRLAVIKDATHWVQHDAAMRVNALLTGFLQG